MPMRRTRTNQLATVLLVAVLFALPARAVAQDPAPRDPIVPTDRTPRVVVPEGRVGIDEANPLTVSLLDTLEMALRQNRDIEIERISTQQAAYDVQAARGVYDPSINSRFFYDSRRVPVASSLGGGPNGRVETETITWDATFQKLLQTGGFLEIGASNVRTDTDNVFASLNPQHQTGLVFTFRQPLVRGFRIDENRRRLRIANIRLDQSDAQFRQRVIETIGAVQRGYWDLAFALRNVDVARESIELAEEQLARLRRLVDEGISAPIELVQVEAELERRRENVLVALEAVTITENNLKSLVLSDRTNPEWDRPIVPAEEPRVEAVTIGIDEAVATAIASRPELTLLSKQSEINEVDIDFYKDQTRPRLDAFASYGLTGLAGRAVENGNPFSSQNEALVARINEISGRLGLDPLAPAPPQSVPDFLVGSSGQSFANLFDNNRAIRVGVEFSFPVGNRVAEANLGRAEAENRKIEAQRQALEQRVEREVRNALQSVQTTRQRVEASAASREAAEVQLRSEQRRFEAGLSTTFLVLTRQTELAEARARELRALTDYSKAVAELQRVLGTTLTVNDIDVTDVKSGSGR